VNVYWQFVKIYTVLAMRDRGIMILTYALPTLFFLFVSQAAAGSPGAAGTTLAMALVVGCLSNGLQGAGEQAVSQRENDMLKRLHVTPISPMPILLASMVSGLLLYVPSVLLMHVISIQLYGTPSVDRLLPVVVIVVVGNVAVRSIGVIVGAVANSAPEATLFTQFLYLPMLLLSGATIPLEQIPAWAQRIAALLPATYLVDAVKGVLVEGEGLRENWFCVVAMLATAAVSMTVARQMFRWHREDKVRPAGKLALACMLLPFLLFALA
jgi:ABC-type multidrug transport system permease subunit